MAQGGILGCRDFKLLRPGHRQTMEVLDRYSRQRNKKQWLEPLSTARSPLAYLMTEPDVASLMQPSFPMSCVRSGEWNMCCNAKNGGLRRRRSGAARSYIVMVRSRRRNTPKHAPPFYGSGAADTRLEKLRPMQVPYGPGRMHRMALPICASPMSGFRPASSGWRSKGFGSAQGPSPDRAAMTPLMRAIRTIGNGAGIFECAKRSLEAKPSARKMAQFGAN